MKGSNFDIEYHGGLAMAVLMTTADSDDIWRNRIPWRNYSYSYSTATPRICYYTSGVMVICRLRRCRIGLLNADSAQVDELAMPLRYPRFD